MKQENFNRLDYVYKLFVVIALIIAAVILAKDILIPILISIVLAVVLMPVVKRLETKMSPLFAIILVLVGSLLIFLSAGWLIANQMTALVRDLPDIQSKFDVFIDKVSNTLQTLGMNLRDQKQFLKDGITSLSSYTSDLLAATTSVLGLLIQVPIYIFLFLIYRDRFRAFIIQLLPDDEEIKWKTDVENVLQGYISGLILVTFIISVLNCAGLLALGIDHAIFFGILSGLLTIIPYVGIFIGATLPVIMALLTKDSLWYPIGIVIIFAVVQFLEGNFITPRITGSRVSINALAAIIALLIGGKILGIAGMILAIPALGVLKIVIGYTHHLKPFVILIEDSPLKTPDDEDQNQL